MTAYLLVQAIITDETKYAQYRDAVVPLIAQFGGRHVRGGPVELLEGQQDERRLALFEFPSMEALHAFWHSPAYAPVKALRRDAAVLDIWAIPGVHAEPNG